MSIRCAVLGVGQTHHTAVRDDVSIPGLIRESALRALKDAEMTWSDIDAVVLGSAPDAFEGIMQPELFLAGALGAVASRIGAVKGDVTGIEILETGAGQAVDELVVQIPDATLMDLLVSEVRQVDGVQVEEVRSLGPDAHDPRLAILELASAVVGAVDRTALVDVVRTAVPGTVAATWVAVVDTRLSTVLCGGVGAPSQDWLGAFVEGTASAAALHPDPRSGEASANDVISSAIGVSASGPLGASLSFCSSTRSSLEASIMDWIRSPSTRVISGLNLLIGWSISRVSASAQVSGGMSRNASARSARPGACCVNRFVHGAQYGRVLPHSEIIVATPHGDRLLGTIRLAPDCMWEVSVGAFDINERAVATFRVKVLQTRI